jgi:hypothetical protein
MISLLEIKTNSMDKHKKYINNYRANELYWGLGIENEMYLEFNKKITVDKGFFYKNHNRERYSVNYFSNYKDLLKNDAFNYLSNELPLNIELPLLMNSHSFMFTDRNNNSKRLYTKKNEYNPKFIGCLSDELVNYNSFFKSTFNNNWLYDGDTIEFTTLNFYKTDLPNVINELNNFKLAFIKNLHSFQINTDLFKNYGMLKFMDRNHPFAVYLTNLNNISMFNNGTLHYNITLPTYLDNNKLIKDNIKFVNDHKRAIRIIQWLEPFLICIYNTPDYFSLLNDFSNKEMYSKCSQRCAVSRYIGIGTYDSDVMISGKLLTIKSYMFDNNKYWWYNKYHKESAYTKLDEIGLDINFNKHYNHGIEIRFFDFITDNKLMYESFEFIIYLMDFILENKKMEIENPIFSELWNNLVYNIMIKGKDYILTIDEIQYYNKLLNLNIQVSKKNTINDIYYEIYYSLLCRYNKIIKRASKYILIPIGIYSKLVLTARESTDINLKKYVKSTNYFIKIINKFNIFNLCNKL